MGASSSAHAQAEDRDITAVSRYHELVTGLTDEDKARVATIRVDSQGIIRIPGKENKDFMMTKYEILGSIGDYTRELFGVMSNLIETHWETRRDWASEFVDHNAIETVDLADTSDWFPLFVVRLHVKRIHLIIERQFDNVKLTRALMFLFHLCPHKLTELVVSCNHLLSELVKQCIYDAHARMKELDRTTYAHIADLFRNIDQPPKAWRLSVIREGEIDKFTFTISPNGPWTFH
jgi:hypothetical protein